MQIKITRVLIAYAISWGSVIYRHFSLFITSSAVWYFDMRERWVVTGDSDPIYPWYIGHCPILLVSSYMKPCLNATLLYYALRLGGIYRPSINWKALKEDNEFGTKWTEHIYQILHHHWAEIAETRLISNHHFTFRKFYISMHILTIQYFFCKFH